jgi:hypothetical protein
VAELLDAFTRIGNAHVAWIEVRNGLPTRFAVEQVPDRERLAAPTGSRGGDGRK